MSHNFMTYVATSSKGYCYITAPNNKPNVYAPKGQLHYFVFLFM